MHALNARVRNGRLVLDEPTDLPEGQVVPLVPLEHASANDADAVDELEPPLLSLEEERGLRVALSSLESGKGRTREQVQHTIDAILRR